MFGSEKELFSIYDKALSEKNKEIQMLQDKIRALATKAILKNEVSKMKDSYIKCLEFENNRLRKQNSEMRSVCSVSDLEHIDALERQIGICEQEGEKNAGNN